MKGLKLLTYLLKVIVKLGIGVKWNLCVNVR